MNESLDITILLPALIAGMVVLLTHAPLGLEVIKRGIIFIDLAVAQMAGLGVIIAYVLGFGEHGFSAQAFAVVSALLGAWCLSILEERVGRYQEAIIGLGFIMAASAGILLLAHNPHGGEHLREMLVGQVLWVEWSQIAVSAGVSVVVFAVWMFTPMRQSRFGFYSLFAIAVTVSVQLVGVYLVFASLIVPALAVTLAGRSDCLLSAWGIGVAGYAVGLIVSDITDLPSGAVIVWAIALCGLLYIPLFRKRT